MKKIEEKRSAYVVELSVGPGGSRWAELHAYTEPAHVRGVLRAFGSNRGNEAYHAIWYTATLGVWIVQAGEVVDYVDLHPFLTAHLDGDSAPLDDLARCDAMLQAHRRERWIAEGQDLAEFEDEEIDDVALELLDQIKMRVDWDALAARLPELAAPRLRPGQRTPAPIPPPALAREGSYLQVQETIRFGSYEVECGVVLEGPIDFPPLSAYEDEDEPGEGDEDEDEDDDLDADEDEDEEDLDEDEEDEDDEDDDDDDEGQHAPREDDP